MKKTFILSTLIFGLLGMSCSSSTVASTSTNNSMTRHEVILNSTNFKSYFNISISKTYFSVIANNDSYYWNIKIAGCLSYAFYDGCVTTFDKCTTNKETYTLKLNAAGNGETNTTTIGGNPGTIENLTITGKVIYVI